MSRTNGRQRLETGREHPTKEKVIVNINHHFVLELVEMKERVEGSRVAIEGGHHEFSREPEQW